MTARAPCGANKNIGLILGKKSGMLINAKISNLCQRSPLKFWPLACILLFQYMMNCDMAVASVALYLLTVVCLSALAL